MKTLTALFAILTAVSSSLWGQSTSTITGQVRDRSEAAVPNARVIVTGIETGVEYRTTTNGEGYYTVPSLTPANYKVSAELDGFKKASSAGFKLDTTATRRIDLVLSPADAIQTIEITADPPAIETQSSAVGGTVTRREIESLPLEGRNSLELALTVGGVAGDIGADEGGIYQTVPSAGANLSIGGGRQSSSSFIADGANSTSIGNGRATVTFSPDTIQEFHIEVSTFSAQYGATGGGVVSVVSKSGTNEFHGNAFWFQRNPSLAARRFNSAIPPPLRRNEGGVTFHGPVRIPKVYDGRRKTFFFTSFEPKRWDDAIDQYIRVPTAEERQGDFRNTWVAPGQARPLLYQQVQCFPSEGDCQKLVQLNRTNNTTVYPLFSANDPDPTRRGHVIPKQYFDPLVLKLLQDVPLPNMPYDASGNNYVGRRGVTGTDNRWNLKIDHHLTNTNRMTARYNHIPNTSERYLLEKSKYTLMSYPSDNSKTQQLFLSDTATIGNRMVNELRLAYTFSDYGSVAPGDIGQRDYTKEFGLPNNTGWGYPRFSVGNYLQPSLGMGNNQLLGQYLEHQYQISDDFTITAGRHTIKMGMDVRLQQLNVKAGGLGDACCGNYTFTEGVTQSGNANIPTGAGGNRFASFLLGVPAAASLRGVVIPYYYRWRVGAAYIQDDFKVKPNLTVNVGVRWQYNSTRAEKYNRQATIDLSEPVPLRDAAGRLTGYSLNYIYSGAGTGSRYLEPVHKFNLEPRLGFAWTPGFGWNKRKAFVVRGGWGVSHPPNTGRGRDPIPDFGGGSSGSWNYQQWTGTGSKPVTQSQNPQYLIGVGRNAPAVISNPIVLEIPQSGKLCAGCSPVDARVPSGNLVAFVRENNPQYVQTWNLTMQFQLTSRFVMSASYLGQKGTHLFSPMFNLNSPDIVQYQNLLDAGGDPLQTVPDPFSRVDSAGNLRLVTRQDLMRPYPTLGNITVVGMTNSNSIYHAGTFEVSRRTNSWLDFRFNYTWGKSIDNSSVGSMDVNAWTFARYQAPLDLKMNRSVSVFDSRHRFNLTLTSRLPFGRGRRLSAGRYLNPVVSNWNVNSVASLYSGIPFSPYLGDANGIPDGATRPHVVRPDIVTGVPLLNPRWTKSAANDVPYVNPQAFARPAFGKLGNAARTLDWLRDPWTPTLNIGISREIRPWEKSSRYLQLRGEFFNALNHTSFKMNANSSPGMFTGSVPATRTGVSLAGALPYLSGTTARDWPTGSREAILAQYYSANFGMLLRSNNAAGRIVQIALKLYW